MKKINKFGLLAMVLSVLLATVIVSGITKASTNKFTAEQKTEMMANHQVRQQAMIDGDYSTWETMMQTQVNDMRQRADDLASKITPDTFAKLQEAQQLFQAGKTEEAKVIMEELGIGGFGPRGKMFRHGDNFKPNFKPDIE